MGRTLDKNTGDLFTGVVPPFTPAELTRYKDIFRELCRVHYSGNQELIDMVVEATAKVVGVEKKEMAAWLKARMAEKYVPRNDHRVNDPYAEWEAMCIKKLKALGGKL